MGKKAAQKKASPPSSKETASTEGAAPVSYTVIKTGKTWTEKLLPWQVQDDMVYENPDINRTASLYSRTDL